SLLRERLTEDCRLRSGGGGGRRLLDALDLGGQGRGGRQCRCRRGGGRLRGGRGLSPRRRCRRRLRGGRGRFLARRDPEHLVLHVGALGAVGVDGDLDVVALLGLGGDALEVEVVLAGGVEVVGAAGGVPADRDGVLEQVLAAAVPQRRRLQIEAH